MSDSNDNEPSPVKITCCNCGVPFYMTPELYKFRAKDAKTFHCPNGHPQRFGPSKEENKTDCKEELEALQLENDKLMRQVEMLEAELEDAKTSKPSGFKIPFT